MAKKVKRTTYEDRTIKVLNREDGATRGTKRAKALDILLASKTTTQAIPRLRKLGADNSFIAFAVRSGFIKLEAACVALLLPSPAHAQQITPCPATGNAAPHFAATYQCYTSKTMSPAMLAVSSAGAAAIVGITTWAVRRHHHHHAAAAAPAPQPHTDPCMIDGLWVKAECAQQVKP